MELTNLYEDQAPSDLEEVNRHFIYSCGVCGKNSALLKNGGDAIVAKNPRKLHSSGCVRIGMKTYFSTPMSPDPIELYPDHGS